MSDQSPQSKVCFIIMPISDIEGYESGHFKRVYEYIIKPACIAAGFTPIRADDVKKTNVIVIDILQKLISSEMAICDLSAQNPNVLYELGIRQAFDLPVSFIKDNVTTRIFDIQGFRDIEYDSSLRIDEVNSAVEILTTNIIETYESKSKGVNSIIELLGITKAKVTKNVEISSETELILKSLHDISLRLGIIESKPNLSSESTITIPFSSKTDTNQFDLNGEIFSVGEMVSHHKFGEGKIVRIEINKSNEGFFTITFPLGTKHLIARFAKLVKIYNPNSLI